MRHRLDPHHHGAYRAQIESLATIVDHERCSAQPLIDLVESLRVTHDLQAAGGYLDRVVNVCRFPTSVHRLAYQVHVALSELDSAIRDATRWIEISPGDRDGYIARSEAFAAQGSWRRAAADEMRAYRLSHHDDELLRRAVEHYALVGNGAEVAELDRWRSRPEHAKPGVLPDRPHGPGCCGPFTNPFLEAEPLTPLDPDALELPPLPE